MGLGHTKTSGHNKNSYSYSVPLWICVLFYLKKTGFFSVEAVAEFFLECFFIIFNITFNSFLCLYDLYF